MRNQKTLMIITIIVVLITLVGCGKNSENHSEKLNAILTEANIYSQNGVKEKAKEKYEEAIKLGSQEAKFQMAARYLVDSERRLNYLKDAALEGYSDALILIIHEYIYEAQEARPYEALKIINQTLKNNPNVLSEEIKEEKIILEKAVEFEKQKLPIEVENCIANEGCEYSRWELAEQYSTGTFGNYDSKVIGALIVSSGGVPAEYKSAVEWAYENHTKKLGGRFNICDHATSGLTVGYCSQRESKKLKEKIIDNLMLKLKTYDDSIKTKIFNSLNHAQEYLESHVWSEVVTHMGSIRNAEATLNVSELFKKEMEIVIRIAEGWIPDGVFDLSKNQNELEHYYDNAIKVTKGFKKYYIEDEYEGVTPPRIFPGGVKETQEKWEIYKKAMAESFYILNPRLSKKEWEAYLTKQRAEFLKGITSDLEY